MILGNFRLCVLGALLAGLAVPSLAAVPDEPGATVKEARGPGGQRADAGRSRRVELPFPLDVRSPDREPRAPRVDNAPHPFRENLLKRVSLAEPESETSAIRRHRLSRYPDFS